MVAHRTRPPGPRRHRRDAASLHDPAGSLRRRGAGSLRAAAASLQARSAGTTLRPRGQSHSQLWSRPQF